MMTLLKERKKRFPPYLLKKNSYLIFVFAFNNANVLVVVFVFAFNKDKVLVGFSLLSSTDCGISSLAFTPTIH